MDFLNQREGGVIFYQVFLLSPLYVQCTVVTEETVTVFLKK